MISETSFKNAYVSQRAIYDERYRAGYYDQRSYVHVLKAEREALRDAVERAVASNPRAQTISLFDFGYGTGRVTNEFIGAYVDNYAKSGKNLLVVAYDVASAGLQKAYATLRGAGFAPDGSVRWAPDGTAGYVAGRIVKEQAGVKITVVFVHGHESQHPKVMRRLALAANGGNRYLVTASWYGSLGHIPGERLRREYFCQLGNLTARHGEMVMSVSGTGDLVELQPEFSERLAKGDNGGFPIHGPGDLVYETELGQSNFYHLFGIDLNDHMGAITGWGQHWWVQGIRCPDEAFGYREAERANYRRVLKANEDKRGRRWDEDDFRDFHMVAAFRSPHNPGNGTSARQAQRPSPAQMDHA